MKQIHLMLLFLGIILQTSNTVANNLNTNNLDSTAFMAPGMPTDEEIDRISNKLNIQTDQLENSNSNSVSNNSEKASLPNKGVILKGWITVKSIALANNQVFPTLDDLSQISINKDFSRINMVYKKGSKIPPTKYSFYARLNSQYLYYSSLPTDINILQSISFNSIEIAELLNLGSKCFTLITKDNHKFTICLSNNKEALKWLCNIQKIKKLPFDRNCDSKITKGVKLGGSITIKTVTKPFIIIPMPSKICNQEWNYEKKGADWECDCKEGKEQSPIDLPEPKESVDSPYKPVFEYENVEPAITTSFPEEGLNPGDIMSVVYDKFTLRIKHPNFGKIITPDGGVYRAQQIVFHTPSEHTISGKRYDLEMQVIHQGISRGDIAKSVILSFLFTKKPGSYNKFFDKMDVYNLPNPLDKVREIKNSLFIPHIFFDTSDQDMFLVQPFSFYTYQGSLTTPPCTERTVHYVASKPIPLSNTLITLLREALRPPDMMDSKGNIMLNNKIYKNYRVNQLNYGRTIFHYDHEKYNCPDLNKKTIKIQGPSHYEKVVKESSRYFFVPGFKPSGLPNSYVVPVNEAENN